MQSNTSAIVILFDGRCGLCQRSMRTLKALDWLHRLTFMNLHDDAVRTQYAPTIALNELNAQMHIRLDDGSYRKGFFAFRKLCFALPLLWILSPILYVPGVSWIGEKAYGFVAKHR